MRHLVLPALLFATLAHAGPARAAAAPGLVVAELFTSESCSSCPPADDLLAELAQTRPDVLPLAFHVDYWNHLSWRDRFSFAGATARQQRYAATLGSGVYTPQLVAGGQFQAVGSNRAAVFSAIEAARAAARPAPAVAVQTAGGADLAVAIGSGSGRATVLLVDYDRMHTTHVGSGENGGVTLTEANAVRGLTKLGEWSGAATTFRVSPQAGERHAVILQAPDGRILAAADDPHAKTQDGGQ
jgi:hypothetical protein